MKSPIAFFILIPFSSVFASADSPDQEEKRYFFLDSEALNIVNFDVGTFWKNSSTTLSGSGDRSRIVSSHVSRYRVGSKSLKTFDQEFRVSGNTLIIKEAFSSSPTDVQFVRCE